MKNNRKYHKVYFSIPAAAVLAVLCILIAWPAPTCGAKTPKAAVSSEPSSSPYSQGNTGPDAAQLVKAADEALVRDTAIYTMKMIEYKKEKVDKEYTIEVWIKGNDKTIIRFLEPPRERGRAILMNGDDMWMYLPDVNRSMRVSPKARMMGTDFSNADVANMRLLDDYSARMIGPDTLDGGAQGYKLELKRRHSKAVYDRILYWIGLDHNLPLRREFYVISGKLLKTLSYSEPCEVSGRLIPRRWTMESALSKDKKTVMTTEKVIWSPEIDDTLFTQGQLSRWQ
ncbi:MAG: outer membrane lipoprotein-sorting protein [bacterium]